MVKRELQAACALGIDFGTSNSTAGWLRPGHPTLLPLEGDKATLPSVVFFNAESSEISYGRAALAEYLDGYEGRLMRSLKSLLGSSLMDEQTEINGTALPFRELLRCFIQQLKDNAEQAAGRDFEQAVLGRPVFFVDDDAQADQRAQDTLEQIARACGLREVSFQFEPIAAAFHYEQQLQQEQRVLIADIGGGTSDFSIVRLGPERAWRSERQDDLLANGGVHIGGTDFDKYLSLAGVMPLFGYGSRLKKGAQLPSACYFNFATWHTINFNYTRKMQRELQDLLHDAQDRAAIERLSALVEQRAGHWLAMQVEDAKISLSTQDQYRLDLARISAGLEAPLSRAGFEQAVSGLLERIDRCVQELLHQSGLQAGQIDCIYFTGGSSGIPVLRQRIARLLPQAQAVEGDLFGSIGAGLAVDAARRYGWQNNAP